MIVAVEGFGSIWSVRKGSTPERTAFYNTTGIAGSGQMCHRSRVFGQIRFNAVGGFKPRNIESNVGSVFQSPGLPKPDSRCLLLRHLLSRPQLPDYYLF